MNSNGLDEMIKKYEKELLGVYEKRNPLLKEEPKNDETEERAAFAVMAESTAQATPEPELKEAPPIIIDESRENEEPTSEATFFANVTAASGAYPVSGAKVIVKRGGELFAFLTTDQSGDTPKTVLPAYSEEDSLSPQTARVIEYTADIIAEGFEEKKDLLIDGVGGSKIFLSADLTPSAERMN